MGRHHPSKNDDKQWSAADLTEHEARSVEHTDHHEHAPNRAEKTEKDQNDTVV